MYAVIKTGGKQYKVEPDEVVRIEKIEGKKGDKVTFEEVMASHSGTEITVGEPMIEGAKVVAEIVNQGRERKVTVFKYKAKKRVRTKTGHRQPFTTVKIKEIVSAS